LTPDRLMSLSPLLSVVNELLASDLLALAHSLQQILRDLRRILPVHIVVFGDRDVMLF
jgi:hypothetical protein